MPNKKITQLASAEATVAAIFPVVVSGQNQQLGLRDMMVGLGIPQYVEGTVAGSATAQVASLPAGSTIFSMYVKPLRADNLRTIQIGRAGDQRYFAEMALSNVMQDVTVNEWVANLSRLQGTSGAVTAVVTAASANSNFVVGIGYFRT